MSILLQMTLFLGTALLIVPFAKRLGIATVLGYLITGILIGPSVLNLTHDSTSIAHLADFGVIFLMFLIGLELRPQRLWQMRHAIFALGSLQFFITGIILTTLIWLIFSIDLSGSIVIGFALALSSTAFVVQLLKEKQQLNSTYGQHSFSILLFQDIAAIPLLAIVPLLAHVPSIHHGIAYFAAIIATFSGLFLFSRYIIRPFFRFVANSGAKELLTAIALFIVLAVVLLMDTLGISTTLGAFITGVLLADSEFRHEFEASLAPFKGLLLGLFFVTIGMTTPLDTFFNMPLLIIGSALGLLIIKACIMLLIGRYNKNTWKNSLFLGVCLAQGGEFAFVILNIAQHEQLMTSERVTCVTLIVIISMLITPILYWFTEKYLAPQLKHPTQPEFDEIPPHNHTMLIAGFGRVGQIIARVAHVQHIPFTAIDNNLEQINFVRQYGGKVYYGDATQHEVLHAAGIEHIQVFVLAIDDIEDSLNTARLITLHYPNIKILARARNRHHVHLLKDLGVHHIWREMYLSSLSMAYAVLQTLGIDNTTAYKSIEKFKKHDEKLLIAQQTIYQDEKKVFETHRNALAELEHLFESDTPPTDL